jgi:hypothetical protein
VVVAAAVVAAAVVAAAVVVGQGADMAIAVEQRTTILLLLAINMGIIPKRRWTIGDKMRGAAALLIEAPIRQLTPICCPIFYVIPKHKSQFREVCPNF